MMWSKLRHMGRSNLCEQLRDRLDFHVAVYRKFHDYGRAWIAIDGKQTASWSCVDQTYGGHVTVEELQERFPTGWSGRQYDRFAAERGLYSKQEFMRLLSDYLNMDPHVALSSPVPLTRALAVADKRVGRRTLERLDIERDTDPIVRLLYQLRTQTARTRRCTE